MHTELIKRYNKFLLFLQKYDLSKLFKTENVVLEWDRNEINEFSLPFFFEIPWLLWPIVLNWITSKFTGQFMWNIIQGQLLGLILFLKDKYLPYAELFSKPYHTSKTFNYEHNNALSYIFERVSNTPLYAYMLYLVLKHLLMKFHFASVKLETNQISRNRDLLLHNLQNTLSRISAFNNLVFCLQVG